MGTICITLVADVFLFYYERHFMLSLSHGNQPNVTEVVKSTLQYIDDILNNTQKNFS